MGDCYKEIAHLLKEEKWVLFTGTSCQVAGLINYLTALRVSRDNLLTIDFFCHGVPSPKIWHDFLKFYESEKHHTPVGYRFRGKKYGWRNHHHHLIYFRHSCTFCTPHFFYINSNKPTAGRTKAIHRRLELSFNLYLLLLFVGQNRAFKSLLHITLRIFRFLQFFNK